MKDLIIIGGGTAGLSAAIYARRGGLSVVVIESTAFGGQIVNAGHLSNYPALLDTSGFEYSQKLHQHAESFGTEFINDEVQGLEKQDDFFVVQTVEGEYQAKSVILATGTTPRHLGLEQEDVYLGRGLSYCAHCDGNFYKGKTVAVVGGGNSAFSSALYLSRLAKKVYLINRRSEFRAIRHLVDALKAKENVEFVLDATIESLNGEEALTGITIKQKQDEHTLAIDGLFVAIGQVPQNENYKKLVDLDEAGYIIADETCTTKTDGLFVAGDARTKELRQLVTAASDGAIAATKAINYLK